MVSLPANWGKGKPMKKRPEPKFKLIYFQGGPNDGQLVRWWDPTYPPYWNHIVREILPITDEDEMPEKACIVGKGKLKDGRPCLLQEVRILHRYTRTTQIRGDGAQVYEPAGGPVPIEWDDLEGTWADPSKYDVKGPTAGGNPLSSATELKEEDDA